MYANKTVECLEEDRKKETKKEIGSKGGGQEDR